MLIHHIDDLDELLTAISKRRELTKPEFVELVGTIVKEPPLSSPEIDLLYRVLDTNRDGLLEAGEVLRKSGYIIQ